MEKFHRQTYSYVYEPAFSGECKVPLDSIGTEPLDQRKIIARRAVFEAHKGALLNLGIGIPASVSSVAAEEKVSDELMMTVEPGIYGGVPVSGQVSAVPTMQKPLLTRDSNLIFMTAAVSIFQFSVWQSWTRKAMSTQPNLVRA